MESPHRTVTQQRGCTGIVIGHSELVAKVFQPLGPLHSFADLFTRLFHADFQSF